MIAQTRRTLAACSLAAAATLPIASFAADMNAFEKAELAQLSPKLRAEVEARMTGGQTVRGILETMLLNNISMLFVTSKVTAVDFELKRVEVR